VGGMDNRDRAGNRDERRNKVSGQVNKGNKACSVDRMVSRVRVSKDRMGKAVAAVSSKVDRDRAVSKGREIRPRKQGVEDRLDNVADNRTARRKGTLRMASCAAVAEVQRRI